MSHSSNIRQAVRYTLAAAAFASAYAVPATAQTELEEVVITGSRIVRPDYEATSPVVTVDGRRVQAVGRTADRDRAQHAAAARSLDHHHVQQPVERRPGERRPSWSRHQPHAGPRGRRARDAVERERRRRPQHDSRRADRERRNPHRRLVGDLRFRRHRRRREHQPEAQLQRRRNPRPAWHDGRRATARPPCSTASSAATSATTAAMPWSPFSYDRRDAVLAGEREFGTLRQGPLGSLPRVRARFPKARSPGAPMVPARRR